MASHPGRQPNLQHGAFDRTGRALEPRVREIIDELLVAPHITDLDSVAVREAARLTALIEALDDRIHHRLRVDKRGVPTALLDIRGRYSRRLADWLDRLGCTPSGRASWARTLAEGGLAAEIARRRAEAVEAEVVE